MSARWLLVFSVASVVADRLPSVLERIPKVVVASVPDDDQSVLTVEVDADPKIIDDVLRQVRAADPNALRLHDSIISTPTPTGTPASKPIDFEFGDEPQPCEHCADWRHEAVTDAGGQLVLREWHQADCAVYESWL
ncbi:hypothetical protein GCM10009821_21430 [Aeromicrobium halocynthiae]|uniref:Uncharacterized protein n=1 Tax=Aeromicrobium halocynthiae TaxID=560557 RepID=A0ABN2W2L3_9ACTN